MIRNANPNVMNEELKPYLTTGDLKSTSRTIEIILKCYQPTINDELTSLEAKLEKTLAEEATEREEAKKQFKLRDNLRDEITKATEHNQHYRD